MFQRLIIKSMYLVYFFAIVKDNSRKFDGSGEQSVVTLASLSLPPGFMCKAEKI